MIPFIACALWATQPDSLRYGPEDIDTLPMAETRVDEHAGRLIIELPPVDVPAHGMVRSPVYRWTVPKTVSLYGFGVEVSDGAGHTLPADRLHHVVLTDPSRRDLFLPLALPIFGASKESPRPVLPKLLIGIPLPASTRYIVGAMFINPDPRPIRIRVRITLSFRGLGRIFPLFRAYPWAVDVMYPLGGEGGRHDFDLPPGRSSHSWVGSPAIPGRIVAMGGHAHDYATAIEMVDMTTGDTIWHQVPVLDSAGRMVKIPVKHFYRWNRLGIHIEPSHAYRVAVFYDNPTGVTIPLGGMGSVMGLFVPDRGTAWPSPNPQDPIYRAQINNLLNNMTGMGMGEMAPHHH